MQSIKRNQPSVREVRIWKFISVASFASLILVSAYSWFFFQEHKQAQELHFNQKANILVSAVNQNIDRILKSATDAANSLTQQESVDEDLLNDLLITYPQFIKLRFFSHGKAALDLKSSPVFSFASLDMVKKSGNSNKQLIEAIFFQDHWLITVATPVFTTAERGADVERRSKAVLYSYLQPDQLVSHLDNDALGSLTIQISDGQDNAQPVYSQATMSSPETAVVSLKLALSVNKWELVYHPGSQMLSVMAYWHLIALALLLLLTLFIAIPRALRKPVYTSEIKVIHSEQSGKAANSTFKAERKSRSGVAKTSFSDRAHIFRANDIRGIVGETLDGAFTRLIGRAIGSEAKSRGLDRILVACDGRQSSPSLTIEMTQGLRETGVEVISLGDVPTPLMYFACCQSPVNSGVMITGSHNPPEYNGFKITLGGQSLMDDDIQKLLHRIQNGDFVDGKGGLSSMDILPDYIRSLKESVTVKHAPKIVIDAGNGITGRIAPELFHSLGCHVIPLYCDVDGSFPNHPPDPTVPVNLEDLILSLQKEKADLGLAFDGDGDRIIAVSASGQILWPDQMLMLLAQDILPRSRGKSVVYDIKCSKSLEELILSLDGKPVLVKSGHSFLKKKMFESGAVLGGEFSGHICIADKWFGFDDGLYAGARLLELLGKRKTDLDTLISELPTSVCTPEILVRLDETTKFDIVRQFRQSLSGAQAEINTLDGVRLDFPFGWGLVRASNTSPSLTLRFEAKTKEQLDRIKSFFRTRLKDINSRIDF